jgi:membrane-associated phospholipid phosphatase
MPGLEDGWGLDVVLWFQQWTGPLVQAFVEVFHWLGYEDFFMLLVPLIYWCVDALLGKRLFVMLILSVWSNGLFKSAFARPRPFEVSDQVRQLVEESGHGIPSGHAQNATAIAGPLAYRLKRWWFTALMVLYVVLVSLSRIVAGVHFPQDVIAGALIGLVMLGAYILLDRPLSQWLRRIPMWAELAFVLAVGLAMVVLHPLLIPSDIASTTENSITAISVLIGGGIGFALEARYVRFSAQGEAWKRGARLVLGVIVLLAIRFGLRAAFDGLEPAYLFQAIRYITIGLWAGFGAPWAFVKLNLAGLRTELASEPIER